LTSSGRPCCLGPGDDAARVSGVLGDPSTPSSPGPPHRKVRGSYFSALLSIIHASSFLPSDLRACLRVARSHHSARSTGNSPTRPKDGMRSDSAALNRALPANVIRLSRSNNKFEIDSFARQTLHLRPPLGAIHQPRQPIVSSCQQWSLPVVTASGQHLFPRPFKSGKKKQERFLCVPTPGNISVKFSSLTVKSQSGNRRSSWMTRCAYLGRIRSTKLAVTSSCRGQCLWMRQTWWRERRSEPRTTIP